MSFLQRTRATEWARAYKKRMAKDVSFVTWRKYKARIQRDCRVAEEDVDALRKMRNVKYNNDIEDYVSRMKHLNQRAKQPVGNLKELVRPNLPERVQMSLPMYGKADTPKKFWATVKMACRAHEDALYAMKGQTKTSSTTTPSTTKTESSNSGRAKETPNQAQTKPKTHVGAKQERAKPEGSVITAPRHDDKTRVSKVKREYL